MSPGEFSLLPNWYTQLAAHTFITTFVPLPKEAVELLKSAGKEVFFEYNAGNHFGPLIERIEKGITNLLTDYGTDRV